MSSSSATTIAQHTFERYDIEFQEILQQIEISIQENKSEQYIQNLIQQCHDLIKQMSVEARSISSDNNTIKSALLDKVRNLKSQLTTIQTKVSTQSLFRSNTTNNNSNNSNGNKNKYEQMIQQNEASIQNQNDILERTKRSILETEQVAYEITDELAQNRQTLLSSQNRLRSIGSMTNTAKQVLSNMQQRNIQHKMILYAVALAFVFAFFFLLYNLWR